MSQEDLARAMAARGFRWHQATVYKTETGTRRVRLAEASAVAAILGVPVGYLTGEGEHGPEVAELRTRVRLLEEASAFLVAAALNFEHRRESVDAWIGDHPVAFEPKTSSDQGDTRAVRAQMIAHARAMASRTAADVVTETTGTAEG